MTSLGSTSWWASWSSGWGFVYFENGMVPSPRETPNYVAPTIKTQTADPQGGTSPEDVNVSAVILWITSEAQIP